MKEYKSLKTGDIYSLIYKYEHAVWLKLIKDNDGNIVEDDEEFYIDIFHFKNNYKIEK